jgi:SpoVK/Ycf46/Vps4 family AAA+-type ATPase
MDQVIERYRLSIGDLAAISRRGLTTLEEARALCQEATRLRLGDLGQTLDCPFVREDLLLPPALDRVLDDFLFEARARARFWEGTAARRLFPRGRGLVGLMTGPPGTGKTMAAQVIARELGLDLVRIDLATCLSKYIGETAKNLHRIFAQAAEMNAVLLFDEADALFSKRTEVRDAHDRYANTDTNYLLQLIEDFEGVALLTSNQKQNMDGAFTRRIRFLFDFPRPSPRERMAIWQRLVRELAGADREMSLRTHLGALANRVDLSGAQIKISLLGAMFAAARAGAPLSLEHIYHGINQELLKEGRSVSVHDRQRIEGGRQ